MTTPGDRLRDQVARMIVARPGDELARVLGGEGDLWIVAAKDIDWTDRRRPYVESRFVQGFHRGDLWTRMAAANPDGIEVTGYPVDDGSHALVFDYEVGSRPVHENTRVGLSATPHGVTLYVTD
jgi:hypothetical protein